MGRGRLSPVDVDTGGERPRVMGGGCVCVDV